MVAGKTRMKIAIVNITDAGRRALAATA